MPAMSSIHREILSHVEGQVRAVFLDTTAGYETNVEAITAKAVEYYSLRLQTELAVASFRHASRASLADSGRAVAQLRNANFIFAGPGSPTYALEQWRGSAVWEAVLEAFHRGAHLLFASAATITLGRYALPVYEIFKAGKDPYWAEGLDLLGELGLNLAIVPHYNDNSGGENYDSRFCYMGATRYDLLQAQLPDDVTIIGIDEYTGVRFDPRQELISVVGQGSLTVLAEGERQTYPAGSTLPFNALRSTHRKVIPTQDEHPKIYGYEYASLEDETPVLTTDALGEYVSSLPGLDEATRIELLARTEAALRAAEPPERVDEASLLELILELRSALRTAKRWDLADKARDVLLGLGYEIQDTPDGSNWRRQ